MNSPKLQEAGIRAQSFPFQRALPPSLLFSIFISATEPFFQTFHTDKKEKQRIALDEEESGGEARVHYFSPLEAPERIIFKQLQHKALLFLPFLNQEDTKVLSCWPQLDESPGEQMKEATPHVCGYLEGPGNHRVLTHLLFTCLLTPTLHSWSIHVQMQVFSKR